MNTTSSPTIGFHGWNWCYSYKTSAVGPEGQPTDILRDFYIPALSRSLRYDRVAGFFRSTSLAAASQGFSAFTAEGGRMRMVVGADLERDDVQAILQGDAQRLEEQLGKELEGHGTWPEDVKNGVELLAWMVARNHLEVRVAFRVHQKTGAPIPFSSVQDGYVHEKWAIFTDREGHRLYISGSLNESKTALALNAENIDVHADWWGGIDRQRIDEAAAGFEILWNDQNPYLRVFTLPEAVRQRLIEIAHLVTRPREIDGSTCHKPPAEPPSPRELLQFALIRYGPKLPGGRYVGLETAPIAPWPHQDVVARRLIDTWPASYLLCDEVGLGKTIEAGLALRSLVLSGWVKRVLIAAPASLTQQWQREMAAKFFLPFARAAGGSPPRHEWIFPTGKTALAQGLYQPDLCIVSTGLMRRPERLQDLENAAPFDVALVDEAHYARRSNSAAKEPARVKADYGQMYELLEKHVRAKARALWMATATPMQLDWIEAYDLFRLTHRTGAFQDDPTLTGAYYELLATLARGQEIREKEWDFLRRAVQSLEFHDPFLHNYLQQAVIDGRIRSAYRSWIERNRIPRGNDRMILLKLLFAAAPLSRVMLRHTRPLLEIYRDEGHLEANLARREIAALRRIVFSPHEQAAYEELEKYCQELARQIERPSRRGRSLTHLGFYLCFLRRRFASSLFAIQETLRRRLERVQETLLHQQAAEDPDLELGDFEDLEEDNEEILKALLKNRSVPDLEWERGRLEDMLRTYEGLRETPTKTRELLKILDQRRLPGGRIRQTVIFTQFSDTLNNLVDHLRSKEPKLLIGTYSGQGGRYVDPQTWTWRGVEREEIKHRFLREEIDLLFCTDAAAEGLNLQTADMLINFDLPWNPMKVEQRIGRIDRIGQKHKTISVHNLCYQQSVEETVYGRLLERLRQAGQVVGTQQNSLLPVGEEDFRKLAEGKMTPEQLEQEAPQRIARQKELAARMEIRAHDLYDIYSRLAGRRNAVSSPVTLAGIWQALIGSRYLRDKGCTVSNDPDRPVFTLRGIEGIPEGTLITADRNLYEQGLPGESQRLHFASYGDPVFEKILEEFARFELPSSVAMLTAAHLELQVEIVAFAAAAFGPDGSRHVRLVQTSQDLEALVLDSDTPITGEELRGLQSQLNKIATREWTTAQTASRIERVNRRAAAAQEILNGLIAERVLEAHTIPESNSTNFWNALKQLDSILEERGQLMVPRLPVEKIQPIQDNLLLELKCPRVGTTFNDTLAGLWIKSALDTAARLADGMKVSRSELEIKSVLPRLQRDYERKLRMY